MENIISDKMRQYNYLFSELESIYHESSVKLGMSDSVSIILYTLCNFGGSHPLGEICRRSGLSKQTANSAIRKLERDGIVYLEAIDGKAKMVCLTEKGKRFASKTVLRLMEIENSIYDSWPEEDLDQYLHLTERFLTAMKEKIGEL